jgi:hypothetical protein
MLHSTVAEVAGRLARTEAPPFPVAARSVSLAVQAESETCRMGRQPEQQAVPSKAATTLA